MPFAKAEASRDSNIILRRYLFIHFAGGPFTGNPYWWSFIFIQRAVARNEFTRSPRSNGKSHFARYRVDFWVSLIRFFFFRFFRLLHVCFEHFVRHSDQPLPKLIIIYLEIQIFISFVRINIISYYRRVSYLSLHFCNIFFSILIYFPANIYLS